ncbi:MAG: hypothetical protein HYS20_12725 [Rhodocyclales bacterium]|nr:hypothetical protein [Rhodocyclales bacterium]
MAEGQMTLWRAIATLAQQIPFSKTRVESVLSVRLKEQSSTTHTVFLEGGPVSLEGNVTISRTDLRLALRPDDPGLLLLEIAGDCITLDQLHPHYPDLKVSGNPRGKSLDEHTIYSVDQAWGKLSFGFKVRNPDCLDMIGFDPRMPG